MSPRDITPFQGGRALKRLDLQLIRDLAALLGGEFAGKALGFVVFAYLARALGPDAYGAVELAVALGLFFALVVDFGLGPIGARHVAQSPELVDSLAAQIPAARLLLAVVAVPVMIATAASMRQSPVTLHLVILFAIGLLAAPWFQRWLFQGLEMMGWLSAAQPIRMLVFGLGVVLFVHGPQDVLSVGYAEIASAGILALCYIATQHWLITPVRVTFQWSAVRDLMLEGYSLGLGQIVWALNQYLSTLLVAFYLASEEIAYFGAAGRIVLSLTAFMHLYHFNLFPVVARALRSSGEAYMQVAGPSLRVTAWLGIATALPGIFVATPLCQLAFGEDFAASGPPLAIILWTLPIHLVSGHARYALIAAGQQRYVLMAQLAGVVTTLAIGLPLIPLLGPLGAAIAMLSSFLVVWFMSQIFVNRTVVRIPQLRFLARPLAATTASLAVAFSLDLSSWWAGLAATTLFIGSAPLLDRELIDDARKLARVKEFVPGRFPP